MISPVFTASWCLAGPCKCLRGDNRQRWPLGGGAKTWQRTWSLNLGAASVLLVTSQRAGYKTQCSPKRHITVNSAQRGTLIAAATTRALIFNVAAVFSALCASRTRHEKFLLCSPVPSLKRSNLAPFPTPASGSTKVTDAAADLR